MTTDTLRKESTPAMRLVGMRHVGPYHLIGNTWGLFKKWAAEHNVPMAGAKHISVFHDNPCDTPREKLRSDACVAVPADFQIPGAKGLDAVAGEPVQLDVPAGVCAVWTYRGSYDGLGKAWDQFAGELIPAAGFQFGPGLCYEHYVNHVEKPEDGECVTDLYTSIKP